MRHLDKRPVPSHVAGRPYNDSAHALCHRDNAALPCLRKVCQTSARMPLRLDIPTARHPPPSASLRRLVTTRTPPPRSPVRKISKCAAAPSPAAKPATGSHGVPRPPPTAPSRTRPVPRPSRLPLRRPPPSAVPADSNRMAPTADHSWKCTLAQLPP